MVNLMVSHIRYSRLSLDYKDGIMAICADP